MRSPADWLFRFVVGVTIAASAPLSAESRPPFAPEQIEFFEKNVRPLLVANCYTCHSANTNSRGGLRVDDRNGLVQGGNRGSAVVPGDSAASLLIQAVRKVDKAPKMPPDTTLTEEEISVLETWINDGAAWPETALPEDLGSDESHFTRIRESHWSWQPLNDVRVPEIAGSETAWPRDDVDRFILAKLHDRGVRPIGDADKVSLIRRVTFDLTGLPPSPEDVDAFLADTSEEAFAVVVDRLLASPAFGERWGRHWLDVARYGESTGSARNLPYPHAWRYRDYVIDSFNADKPYDKFLREQIAGDLLPANSPSEKAEQLIATGFLALGVKDVNQRFKVRFVMDNIDEQIDTVTRSVLGLTVSCARCHDHKFDPIPAQDYYALAGIFHSTDLCGGLRNKMGGGGLDYYDTDLLLQVGESGQYPAEHSSKVEKARKAVEEARQTFQTLRDSAEGSELAPNGRPKRQVARQRLNQKQAELNALLDPAQLGPVAYGVRDAKVVRDTELRVRGEAELLGPVVPRGFLSIVSVPDVSGINPKQSGRLELADWLASPHNPLTSRVVVNRIWKHLFHEGLVSTVDNFGVTGAEPTHPELLDYLAAQFVNDGWSFKRMVRRLVLTRTYQLSAEATPEHLAIDPANRLLWRHTPRRLDAEEIRDAMLAATATIVRGRPETSLSKELRVVELRNNGPEARTLAEEALVSRHRSVYLPLLRGLVPVSLTTFDFAEQGMVTGRRDTTTVAPQALYLLNDPFVRDQSRVLAERLLARADADDKSRVEEAYRLTLGRLPTPAEVEQALAFSAGLESVTRDLIAAAEAEKVAREVALVETGEEPADAVAQPPTNAAANVVALANTDTASNGSTSNRLATNGSAANGKAAPQRVAVQVIDVAADPDAPLPEVPVAEEEAQIPTDPRLAAWSGLCQALLGSAEFRYLK